MDTTKQGTFQVDQDNNSVWTPKGAAPQKQTSQAPQGLHPVEVFTGSLNREDPVPTKPIAAMSFGQRVRIARLFLDHKDFLGKVIKVGGWAKSTRA